MNFERIHVRSRDEYQAGQEPKAFEWRGSRFEIIRILERWREGRVDSTRSPLRCFKVLTDGDQVFVLRYHEHFRTWSILAPPKDLDG